MIVYQTIPTSTEGNTVSANVTDINGEEFL